VSRELREHGHFNSEKLPWEYRPHALFVAFAPYDAPRYALAVVVEHGNAGAAAAAPVARDLMMSALTRDPAGRNEPPGGPVAGGAIIGATTGGAVAGGTVGGAVSGGPVSRGPAAGGPPPGRTVTAQDAAPERPVP
jgi:hypothetical protein